MDNEPINPQSEGLPSPTNPSEDGQKNASSSHQNRQRRGRQQPNRPMQRYQNNRNQNQNKNQQRRPQGPSDGKKNPQKGVLGTIQLGALQSDALFHSQENLDARFEECFSIEKEVVNWSALLNLSLKALFDEAQNLCPDLQCAPKRHLLLSEILKTSLLNRQPLLANGVLELLPSGSGMLVYEHDNYAVTPESIFIPKLWVQRFALLRGQPMEVYFHPPRAGEPEGCPFGLRIKTIGDKTPETLRPRIPFEDLTPCYPERRLLLESTDRVHWDNLSMRVVDLLTPIGLGQRGLIVAPPRTGKTMLVQSIAQSIVKNNPDVHLMVLLIDERPEEVTDFKAQLKDAEVISSTFDENPKSHIHVAEMVIEKARRLVEFDKDVVIILDSITRLARAYNASMPSSGKILSGGVEANALQKPKRFFGSARNIQDGGSLTIIATALIETGSRMDDVIFEEFKGTGNMELHLDRDLANKRLFPAINVEKSGTRKEELLYHPEEMNRIHTLRRALKGTHAFEAIEMLTKRLSQTQSNTEFLLGLNR